MKNPTWQSEIFGLFETLKDYPLVILLFPMFWSSNWFYPYQQNSVNAARFNTRTRALNGLLYWLMQLVGAIVFGYTLDYLKIRRTLKAKVAWVALFVLTMAIWGGGYAWQRQYTRTETSAKDFVKLDWSDSDFVGGMFLYMFYGFYDACFQTCVYWYMGALTNNSRRLANFVGFYKGIQSAGAAVVFRVDAVKTPFMGEFISCWALLAGSMICALPLVWFKIQDTVSVEEDLRFSDETKEEVMATQTGSISHETEKEDTV